MKLTKKLEKEVMQVYDAYWSGYMNGDMKAFAAFLDDDVKVIGSTEAEVFFNKREALSFYQPTADQITGKAELRNRIIKAEPAGDLVLITEQNDFYILIEDNWTFYAKGRLSTLFQKKEVGWKIIQQHGSMPDIRAMEGEQFALEKISKENLQLRDAIKRRTVELEQKNRELEIEAALERVRARTMAMQKSDELPEAANLLFQQVQSLGMPAWSAGYCIWDEDKKAITLWMSSEGVLQPPFKAPLTEDPSFIHMREAHERGETFYVEEVGGEELITHYQYMRTLPVVVEILDSIIEAGHPLPTFQIFHLAYFSKGFLLFITYEPVPESHHIFKRFAKVFEQTYTRFLDLQKAEAQAREAQIELGLERVRARAMAMQSSNELSELVDTVFKELTKLDFALTWCIINIIDESSLTNTVWAANPDIDKAPESYHMKFEDYPFHHAMMKGWKERKTKYVYVLEGLEKKVYDEYLFNETEFRKVPEAAQAASRAIEKYVVSFSFSNFGGLQTVGDVPLSDANLDILSRFGKVFDLTYTRFNDLQKAEAQARESQIQLAMERVRARAMAMQRSEELSDTAVEMFNQVKALGVYTFTCGFHIFEKEEKAVTEWMSDPGGSYGVTNRIPLTEDLLFIRIREARQKNLDFVVLELSGKELQETYRYISGLPGRKEVMDEILNSGFQLPTFQFTHCAFFSQGYLMFITVEPAPEAHDIFKRFAKVFEQTYTRFLDLQKAEAQARESQIQLALERVRARTMAMQHSDELKDAAALLFQQAKALGVPAYSCGYNIWEKNEKEFTSWMSTQDGSDFNAVLNIPLTEDANFIRYVESKQKGEQFFVLELRGERMQEHYQYLKTIPAFREWFDYAVKMGFDLPETQIHHLANFSHGNLLFITLDTCPEFHDVFKRFAAVFEQTYTRFLDLQKAEAQAREAKIEAALERVRSRTMAMQHSTDLQDTALLLLQQILALGVSQFGCGFNIWDDDRKAFTAWMGGGLGENTLVPPFKVSSSEDIFLLIHEAAERGESLFVREQAGEELETHYRYMNSIPLWKEIMEGITLPTFQVVHCAFFSQGFLIFISPEPISEAHDIFKRFAKVFEQTYTRFLDLQKAEAQAREAQIQLAMERVRARTMAMQKSDELAEAASLLFKQIEDLGTTSWSSGFDIWLADEASAVAWMSNPDGSMGVPFTVPYTEDPFFKQIYEAKQRGEDFFVMESSGKELEETYKYLFNLPEAKKHFDGIESLGFQMPAFQITHCAFFPQGFLMFITYEPVPEMWDIFKRFAKVFEQTYTRFLDLKKAEAQTRQAQIETAMEKVRARALAMQKPDELIEVAQVLRKEMGLLGVEELETSSIYIHDEQTGKTECWYAIKNNSENKLVADHMAMQLNETWVGRQMLAFYHSDEKQISIAMTGTNRKEWIDYCSKQSKILDGFYGENIPDRTYHLNKFTNGYIGAASPGNISAESWELLQRATSVFSLAYTRFSDLQKSEAQARFAIQRASLDRVRAETASMRTTADLEKITPLIWNELTTLGVPFVRCGVFIMDEQHEQIHTFLSTPDGKAIAAFQLPYNTPGTTTQMLEHWRKKEMYKDHWDEAAFIDWTKNLLEKGAIASSENYLTENHPTNLNLHFLPFLQGMLYVGSEAQLSDDEIQVVQALADAFSTAYARYEDFNKLESAKQQVERTVVDLKQAQAQLVQSEKMASLGELTAGIAHEIQNPLNFVNNFSEVNKELLGEMENELNAGNNEEAILIAMDIKENEEKINHHGKRADAIVKGMLQHSRASTGNKEPTDINVLADEYLRLAYHGLRAKDKSFNAIMKTDFDETIGNINIIPQDIGRVILNLITNAFYAVTEKKKQLPDGYEPTVSVSTKKMGDKIEVSVKDNGNGIPQKVLDKIFQPFFTTKPTGQGTGLGLSLSYDIIKAHGGQIKVDTKEGEGTTFTIQLSAI